MGTKLLLPDAHRANLMRVLPVSRITARVARLENELAAAQEGRGAGGPAFQSGQAQAEAPDCTQVNSRVQLAATATLRVVLCIRYTTCKGQRVSASHSACLWRTSAYAVSSCCCAVCWQLCTPLALQSSLALTLDVQSLHVTSHRAHVLRLPQLPCLAAF